MQIIFHKDIVCPYCGFVNRERINSHEVERLYLTNCDDESGGCGLDFVVETSLTLNTGVFKIVRDDSIKELKGDECNE